MYIIRKLYFLMRSAACKTPQDFLLLSQNTSPRVEGSRPSEEEHRLSIDVLTQGLAKFPDSLQLLCARGGGYVCINQADEALADLNKAESIQNPMDGFFYEVRGDAYTLKNDQVRAKQDYDKANEIGY